MARTNPELVVKKALAAFNRHDIDSYIAMLDPDYASGPNEMLPNPPKGREAYRKINEANFKAFPDCKFKIINIAAKGGFVASECTFVGTFKGPWELPGRPPIPPTGRHFEVKMAMFARVNSKGLISELRDYEDPAALLQQLGLKA
jgi:predicted ester cyclase